MILALPVVGMLPLLSNPTTLDATTTSGTGAALPRIDGQLHSKFLLSCRMHVLARFSFCWMLSTRGMLG